MIALRGAVPALSRGSFEFLDLADGVLAYRRTHADDVVTVLVNFEDRPVDMAMASLAGAEVLLVSDDTASFGGFSGVLGPDQAVVVRG